MDLVFKYFKFLNIYNKKQILNYIFNFKCTG